MLCILCSQNYIRLISWRLSLVGRTPCLVFPKEDVQRKHPSFCHPTSLPSVPSVELRNGQKQTVKMHLPILMLEARAMALEGAVIQAVA